MKLNNVKRVLAVALGVSLMTFSLAACGGNNGGGETSSDSAGGASSAGDVSSAEYKIGLALPDRDQYWATFEQGAVAAMEENGAAGDINVAKEDFPTQLSHVQTYATAGYDAVIVGLTDNTSYQELLDAAGDMKVVFFNRRPSDDSAMDGEKAVYVGMSEYDAGKAQGEWLVNYLDEKGADKEVNGVLFRGVLGQPAVTDRSNGAMEALEEGGYTVNWLLDDTAEWDKTKAMDKFTQVLGTGDQIDLVVCNNDEMALGCIEACTASGRDIDFPIVGIDATETGCMAVKDGTMAMTVNQNPFAQADAAVACAIGLIEGSLPAEVDETNVYGTPAEAVTPDEADAVLETFK